MTKITDRTIYEAIMNGTLDRLNDPDYIREWAERKITQIDRKNAKARETAARKRAEGDELKDVVMSLMNDEFQTIADVAASIEGEGVTAAKVAYRLSAGVRDGILEKQEVTVADEDGKKHKAMAYRLAQ